MKKGKNLSREVYQLASNEHKSELSDLGPGLSQRSSPSVLLLQIEVRFVLNQENKMELFKTKSVLLVPLTSLSRLAERNRTFVCKWLKMHF